VDLAVAAIGHSAYDAEIGSGGFGHEAFASFTSGGDGLYPVVGDKVGRFGLGGLRWCGFLPAQTEGRHGDECGYEGEDVGGLHSLGGSGGVFSWRESSR
jgi:hypothetical protein